MIKKGSKVKINTTDDKLESINGKIGEVVEIDFEEEYPVKVSFGYFKAIFTFNELEEVINE